MNLRLLFPFLLVVLLNSCDKVNSPIDNPPNNVTNINFKSLSAKSLEISWENSKDDIDKILIYRSANTSSFQIIATINNKDSTFIDNNLDSLTTYNYYIVNVSKSGKESQNPQTYSLKYELSAIINKFQSPKGVFALQFSKDNKYLTSGGENGSVEIWDMNSNSLKFSLKEPYPDWIINIALSYDEHYIIGASTGEIYLWDIISGTHYKTFSWGSIRSMDSSPTNSIFAADVIYELRVINYLTDDTVFVTDENGEMNDIRDIQFSHDGNLLAVSYYNKIKIFDTKTWQLKYFFQSPYGSEPFNDIYLIRFSPDDEILAAIYGRKKLNFWDIRTQTVLGSHTVQSYNIEAIAFNPSNKTVMIGEWYKIVEWNLESMSVSREFYQDVGDIKTLTFSSDGNYLASDGLNNQIYLWGYSWHLLE